MKRRPFSVAMVLALLIAVVRIDAPAAPRDRWADLGTSRLGPADSAAFIDSIRAQASAFVWIWRLYWEESEGMRHPLTSSVLAPMPLLRPPPRPTIDTIADDPPLDSILSWAFIRASKPAPGAANASAGQPGTGTVLAPKGPSVATLRAQWLHCHVDDPGGHARDPRHIIEAASGKRATCPSWYPLPGQPARDERLSTDAWIATPLLSGLRRLRAGLLEILDNAARRLPGDRWLAGQRVRFALDEGDPDRAMRAAATCRADRWWCLALQGYVLYQTDSIGEADRRFGLALAAMPRAERCAWNDLSLLLEPSEQVAYGRIACDRRDSLNARIWWLAMPLLTDTINERRAEQYARLVMIRLRSATAGSERWDWRDQDGGRAVREMLVRYGWPSLSYWMGPAEDVEHYGYLGFTRDDSLPGGIFATAEYSSPRIHTMPSWSAIENPWWATVGDWDLSPPARLATGVDTAWWPREHFVRTAGPLVQLDAQSGLFRRDSAVILAVASELPSAVAGRPRGDSVDGALVFATAPGTLRSTRARMVVGATSLVRSTVTAGGQLVELEVPPSAPGELAARTRFGIVAPGSLASMRSGEIAISAPVFLESGRPGPTNDTPDPTPDRALLTMYGTTAFRGVDQIGVYWETYGVNDGEPVDVSIRIAPVNAPPGLFKRIELRLGIGAPLDAGVAVEWREPQSGPLVATIHGGVPVQSRSVVMDISRLVPGQYIAEVGVARPGGTPQVHRAPFTILPR